MYNTRRGCLVEWKKTCMYHACSSCDDDPDTACKVLSCGNGSDMHVRYTMHIQGRSHDDPAYTACM